MRCEGRSRVCGGARRAAADTPSHGAWTPAAWCRAAVHGRDPAMRCEGVPAWCERPSQRDACGGVRRVVWGRPSHDGVRPSRVVRRPAVAEAPRRESWECSPRGVNTPLRVLWGYLAAGRRTHACVSGGRLDAAWGRWPSDGGRPRWDVWAVDRCSRVHAWWGARALRRDACRAPARVGSPVARGGNARVCVWITRSRDGGGAPVCDWGNSTLALAVETLARDKWDVLGAAWGSRPSDGGRPLACCVGGGCGRVSRDR